jgi:ATP synthase protein I
VTAPGPDDQRPAEHGSHTGWTVVSYLLTGMLLYGGIGWLLGRWFEVPMLFPIGMLVGLALSTAMIIFRFGRS